MTCRQTMPRVPGTRTDGLALTERNVERQLTAMGSDSYDLLIKQWSADESGRPVEKVLRDFRDITSEDIVGKMPMLRAKNGYENCDILIHPHGSTGLVLVDDVTPEAQQQMDIAGLRPALVVMTSEGNFPPRFQAWVRATSEPIPEQLGTALARELVRRFGADPDAANWRQPGRLAGFTNRKPEHRRPNGLYPYAKVIQDCGLAAPAGPALLAELRAAAPVQSPTTAPMSFLAPAGGPRAELVNEYRQRWSDYRKDHRVDNHNPVDYRLLSDLARAHPDATAYDLAWTVMGASPGLGMARHADDPWRYAIRTALKVLERVRNERHERRALTGT